MILELHDLALGDGPGAPLPPVSAIAAPGRPGIIAVETEQTPVVASLVAGGRMTADSGTLTIDGAEDAARVRRSVALVDTPGVAEPYPVLTVTRIVREELAFAGHRTRRDAVETVLESLDLTEFAQTAIEHVPTDRRIRLLVELALLRDGVEGLVVTSPERHGGAVADWFSVLLDVAGRGISVLLITSQAAADVATALLPPVRGADADPEADPELAAPPTAPTASALAPAALRAPSEPEPEPGSAPVGSSEETS